MARYRHSDIEEGQGSFLSVNLKEQLLPGTFEHMLEVLIGNKIDVSGFDKKYKNDTTGAKAIAPSVLIKLIIYGYAKGIKSSRRLEELGRKNIVAKALTGDSEPHWTTIADFISKNSKEFEEVFAGVLAYCNELGLIGGNTFAIDGLRLPSNASMNLTGTADGLRKRLEVYRRMAKNHISKHQRKDAEVGYEEERERHYQERQKKLNKEIEKISVFLEKIEKKENKSGKEIQSNVTDNESAIIHTSSGYIQGYIGLAVADAKEQVIVSAKAVGSANECEHLPQMLEDTLNNIKGAGVEKPEGGKATILGDKNYFSEENLKACEERGVEAIIPDKNRLGSKGEKLYEAEDFKYHEDGNYYECPAGKKLEYKGIGGPQSTKGKRYKASVSDCRPCLHKDKCMRGKKSLCRKDWKRSLLISSSNQYGSLCRLMREKLKKIEYRDRYDYRLQIIEPVFANIASSKGLDRFTLRGSKKVNGQWQLYCIVHNLSKCLKGYNKRKGYR